MSIDEQSYTNPLYQYENSLFKPIQCTNSHRDNGHPSIESRIAELQGQMLEQRFDLQDERRERRQEKEQMQNMFVDMKGREQLYQRQQEEMQREILHLNDEQQRSQEEVQILQDEIVRLKRDLDASNSDSERCKIQLGETYAKMDEMQRKQDQNVNSIIELQNELNHCNRRREEGETIVQSVRRASVWRRMKYVVNPNEF